LEEAAMVSFAEFIAEEFHSEVKLIWDLTGTLGYKLEPRQRADPYIEFMLRRVVPSQWRS
jgi:hypothetical protein